MGPGTHDKIRKVFGSAWEGTEYYSEEVKIDDISSGEPANNFEEEMTKSDLCFRKIMGNTL